MVCKFKSFDLDQSIIAYKAIKNNLKGKIEFDWQGRLLWQKPKQKNDCKKESGESDA